MKTEILKTKKQKFLLPSSLTGTTIVLGFLAVATAIQEINGGKLGLTVFAGCWMIIFAGLIDGLDGKVARMTNSASPFGIYYDSMADLIAFGLAPAVLFYRILLINLSPVFLIFPIIFLLAASVRLSRFNTTAGTKSKTHHVGMPMPASGSAMCTALLLMEFLKQKGWITGMEKQILPTFIALSVLLSVHMLSTVKYISTKDLWQLIPNPYLRYLVNGGLISLLLVDPIIFFTAGCTYYIGYCSLMHLYFRWMDPEKLATPSLTPDGSNSRDIGN